MEAAVARGSALDSPGHERVRLWSSKKDVPANGLGPLEATRGGWTGCDAMATETVLQLLTDARAMGGKGVVATRFENPAHWAGRPRCRRNWVLLGHMTVHAIGTAVKTSPDGVADNAR